MPNLASMSTMVAELRVQSSNKHLISRPGGEAKTIYHFDHLKNLNECQRPQTPSADLNMCMDDQVEVGAVILQGRKGVNLRGFRIIN